MAKNELVVSGSVDLSTNKPAPSTLAIRSEGLDLNPLHRLFAGDTGAQTKPTAPAPAAARPEVEPEPLSLPLSRLTADIDIAKVFLGTLVGENWKGHLEVDRSAITLKPFGLSLNGSPITLNALANVGVPGWQYDWAFKVARLDVAPLVDTFQPDYKGKITGHLSAEAAFKTPSTSLVHCNSRFSAGVWSSETFALNVIVSPSS